MTNPANPVYLWLLCFLRVVCCFGGVLGGAVRADSLSYNRDVRPILSSNCFYCHGFDAAHREAELRLDTFAGATSDENGSPAIVPGSPEKSELWKRITAVDLEERMPPPESHKKLSQAERQVLKKWIESGAKYDTHWAFVPPVRANTPSGVNAVDYFVEQELRSHHLALSPPADKSTLARRVTIDLTGLPPTLEEFEAFESDDSPDAYARVVDRLLASHRYGEHMAMAWLDAARYADTNGYQMDAYRMNWPWRDWVVRAFNKNMSFDQFTIEQLAGDLLLNPTEDQLVATAFNRNHMLNAEGGTIAEENRTKNVFDRVETTSTVWLGLTMNCAQCHDHKFDPILQRDYYAMFALFNQLSETGGVDKRFIKKPYSDSYDSLYMLESPYIVLGDAAQKDKLQAAAQATVAAKKDFDKAAKEYREPFYQWVREMRERPELIIERIQEELTRRFVTTAPYEDLNNGNTQKLLREFLATQPQWTGVLRAYETAREHEDNVRKAMPHVMIMRDSKPRETFVLKRGNYETPGEKVAAGLPSFLPVGASAEKIDRLALARWMVSADNPLVARVFVNRLWQQFFGRGLVKTPDDFGLQGEFPSHPELLDWLAVEFRASGWDVKHIVRVIVSSRVYQQSSQVTPALIAKDPDNVLLARGPRFRMDSRVIRDQALFLSGLLVERQGGAPVMPYQPEGLWEEMSFGKNRYFRGTGEDLYRRSLYTVWRRTVAPANFFDAPSRQTCAVKPIRTSTPLHALTTLNDTTYVEAARVWAERLVSEGESASRLRTAFRAATARYPTQFELETLDSVLQKTERHYSRHPEEAAELLGSGEAKTRGLMTASQHAAWTTVCLTLLNLDEALCR